MSTKMATPRFFGSLEKKKEGKNQEANLLGKIYNLVQKQQTDIEALKVETAGQIKELAQEMTSLQDELRRKNKSARGRLTVPSSASVSL